MLVNANSSFQIALSLSGTDRKRLTRLDRHKPLRDRWEKIYSVQSMLELQRDQFSFSKVAYFIENGPTAPAEQAHTTRRHFIIIPGDQ